MIKTEFSYEEEEIKDYFRFHLLTKDNIRIIYYVSSLIMAILGLLFVFVFHNAALGFLLIIVAIILVLIFPLQVKRIIKKQVKSRYKRPKEAIIFYEDKIVQNIEKRQVTYSWNQIIEVCETKKYLYLYISSVSALIVNKSKLDDNNYQELISLIKLHLDKITYYPNK